MTTAYETYFSEADQIIIEAVADRTGMDKETLGYDDYFVSRLWDYGNTMTTADAIYSLIEFVQDKYAE